MTLSHLQVRNAKDDEVSIESASQIFSSLLSGSHKGILQHIFNQVDAYSFEIFLVNQTIYFYTTVPQKSEAFIQSLISSTYPNSLLQKTTDPIDTVLKTPYRSLGELILGSKYYMPIKTYTDYGSVDPLAPIIGFLAKVDPRIKVALQILVTYPTFAWQNLSIQLTKPKEPKINQVTGQEIKQDEGPEKSLIQRKISFQGGKTCIRLLVGTNDKALPTQPFLENLAGTFGSFALGGGNKFTFTKPFLSGDSLLKRIKMRKTDFFERQKQILNAEELATIWHPPGLLLKGIKNIAWGKSLAGEPPENLPVAENISEEERKGINFFAKAEYKNRDTIFGIKNSDRRRHIYIIGKTGTGKSTLITNMAIDDIRKDRGVGIIDPHGDLCDNILQFIPKRRLNDVIYLEPFDAERPFSLNVLETHEPQHKHLISSGIVSIFSKLYADSWGPRLEYILRNVILTLVEIPDATLVDVLNLIGNEKYRKTVLSQLDDQVLLNFWRNEFEKMPDRLRAEAVSPIQNKVGQFVSTKMIRNIIGQSKSSINLAQIMNEGKILILNLSQGKLGEDNAALLGAMIITQIQLAAMMRAYTPEEERKDFFLYVDEFQNFATSSFIKILSEARKYRLCLTLTNQYIDQLDETIRDAIFGNVGTLASFVMGAGDAEVFEGEYGQLYTKNDLVGLGKYEIIVKLSIDNMMSSPFPAKTLPLPNLQNNNAEKIVRLSKERYGRKVKEQKVSNVELMDNKQKTKTQITQATKEKLNTIEDIKQQNKNDASSNDDNKTR